MFASDAFNKANVKGTFSDLVDELGARRIGSNWMAKCPAHDDRNPSLSIRTGRDGHVLVHCHSGCSQERVIAALSERGLWSPSPHSHEYPAKWGTLASTYDYVNEEGQLLYQVCRFVPKTFRPRRPDGSGGWQWGYGDVRRVLYRLPEVLEAPIVFVTEGEKDAESLRDYGFVGTTAAGGAKAPWLDSYTETLRGRECIFIPDNDAVGWERVRRIASSLLGTAALVRVLDLPREYKDISDWFAAGHSECELIVKLEGVHAV